MRLPSLLVCLALLMMSVPAAAQDHGPDAARWIRANAAPIASISPDAADGDLAAVSAVVGKARIAGFGEATHGGREFFLLKHRIFRHLVEHDGFTAFAIEANYAEADAMNAYVRGGPGDPQALLSGLGFWTWDTEEVLDLVRWMRAWNAGHARKIGFYGVDIQFAPSNLLIAFDYLDAAGPGAAEERKVFAKYLATATDIAAGYKATNSYPTAEKIALRQAAEDLFQRFESERAQLVTATGESAYLRARAGALAAVWYFLMQGPDADLRFRALRQEYDVRDRAMADLAEAALAMEGKDGRVFLWAHDAHISRARAMDERTTMGRFLSDDLGADYVATGFAFDHGGFQAYPPADPAHPETKPNLTEMRVGPAPAGFSEAVLRAGPAPAYLVDLRRLDPGTPAFAWFDARRPLRWTGSSYSTDLMAKHPPISLAESYDALIFVHETTRARPTERLRARLGLARTW
jgi:erythromycin esterase